MNTDNNDATQPQSSNGGNDANAAGGNQNPTPPKAVNADEPTPASTTGDDKDIRDGQLPKREKHLFKIPPHPNTTFDDAYFLELLEGSISLTLEEKKRVIEAIPRLTIEQIKELINIFEEEKQKFSDLEKEFSDDVSRLKSEREKEINLNEVKAEQSSEEAEAKAQAEALKKQLGMDQDN